MLLTGVPSTVCLFCLEIFFGLLHAPSSSLGFQHATQQGNSSGQRSGRTSIANLSIAYLSSDAGMKCRFLMNKEQIIARRYLSTVKLQIIACP